ncbi:BA75_03853T0 [Komagataella pastoris]|uniref:Phosphoglycerate mutase n=1 Tax=Komagataella pastoris TaxID=4922 RepID=A0A1B2JEC9_PICPA|nr:BA75_03853T0 [Komagataella pastoris]
MTEAKYTIILVRHGQSQWNRSDKFCGWKDVHLSTEGARQAEYSGRLIRESGIIPTVLHTSRLTRSCQTGNIILEQLNRQYIDIYRSWRLNERHYGALQGRFKSDVLKEVGKEKYMEWRRAYEGCPPLLEEADHDDRYKDVDQSELPRGESLKMVLERFLPYVNGVLIPLLEKDPSEIPLLSVHGSIVRALLKHWFSISDEDISGLNIPNAIPLVITLDKNFRPIGEYRYLDPQSAYVEANKVAHQGFGQT